MTGPAQSASRDRRVAPCVICGGGRESSGLLYLTHGVAVWLCQAHRDNGYLDQDAGTVFATCLSERWAAAGALTRRRLAAITTYLQQVAGAARERERPGSYSWPRLRREAEQRFAAGDDPAAVIDELRARHRDAAADVPSLRTMRRWFTQGRWRTPAHTPPPAAARTWVDEILATLDTLPYSIVKTGLGILYTPPHQRKRKHR